jgi:hypothetical protein
MKKIVNHLPESICPICGKTFIPAVGHIYKDKRTYQTHKRVCSWKCVCESERMKEATAQRKSRKRVK